QPAEVAKVVMDEEIRRMEVVVPDDQLSLAIGRRGQNVRLASQLVGWDIDIMTETDESERRLEEMRLRSEHLMDALDVDDVLARLLVTEGFSEADEVAYVPVEELAGIGGLDEAIAQELQSRALTFVEERDRQMDARRQELGVDDALAEIEGLSPTMLVQLGEKDIKTLDDLGDLAGDELIEDYLPGTYLTLDEANAIIMVARAHWFDDEEPAAPEAEAGDAEGGETEEAATEETAS
ncbi:MAG: transcription termination/antitermination protein NusA, partial [Rhodospirillaceae bacterium]|nr:transcription termination/antitermination protein NusA [Rhodospirillaceae bacterium]